MHAVAQAKTIGEYIQEIRKGLVCDRCGRYVGSLATKKYLPPPYPVAVGEIPVDDEVSSLVAFEWHMLGLLRGGSFSIRHPEKDGRCVSIREWLEDEEDGAAEAGEAG